ncbi:MAG: class I SAM-dependent methyltransferase [Candidatus Brocadiia bacterium]
MKKIIAFILRYFFGLFASVYLFTMGFIKSQNRILISTICAHFGYKPKAHELIIPEIKLAEVAPDDLLAKVVEPIGVDGNASLLEIMTINKLITRHQPRRIFEIGTFDGRTTINMAVSAPAEAKIHTLDLPKEQISTTKLPIVQGDKLYIDKNRSGSRYIGRPEANKITQLYGDSATFDFNPYFNSIDFVFIDGSHAYDYILNDSRIGLKLLRNNRGIILWHDYGVWEGVTRALNELLAGNADFKELKHIEGTSLAYLNR